MFRFYQSNHLVAYKSIYFHKIISIKINKYNNRYFSFELNITMSEVRRIYLVAIVYNTGFVLLNI